MTKLVSIITTAAIAGTMAIAGAMSSFAAEEAAGAEIQQSIQEAQTERPALQHLHCLLPVSSWLSQQSCSLSRERRTDPLTAQSPEILRGSFLFWGKMQCNWGKMSFHFRLMSAII